MRIIIALFALTLLGSACSFNNVKEDKSLGHFFKDNQVEGCFASMDNGTGQFVTYNLARYRDSSYTPGGSFGIVRSLIALQTGAISNDSSIFNEGALSINKDTMQAWLDSLGYGARNDKERFKIKTSLDSFWLDNSLKVTPDAQLGLIKQLYFGQLPFFKTYQEMVKRALLKEDNTLYRLGYKTGKAIATNGHAIGWVVGWIEENNHANFFVLNIESEKLDSDLETVGVKMVKDILKEQGFFQGNR